MAARRNAVIQRCVLRVQYLQRGVDVEVDSQCAKLEGHRGSCMPLDICWEIMTGLLHLQGRRLPHHQFVQGYNRWLAKQMGVYG